ncbi:hypothetical protein GCM10023205_82430 [Yinghuangia aomiensis]|uniref:Uncharacterized protein n=1 Tax=Yinghuangia aomiensis TaxID=676205 RepID=A0ABP9IFC4_9ACTN
MDFTPVFGFAQRPTSQMNKPVAICAVCARHLQYSCEPAQLRGEDFTDDKAVHFPEVFCDTEAPLRGFQALQAFPGGIPCGQAQHDLAIRLVTVSTPLEVYREVVCGVAVGYAPLEVQEIPLPARHPRDVLIVQITMDKYIGPPWINERQQVVRVAAERVGIGKAQPVESVAQHSLCDGDHAVEMCAHEVFVDGVRRGE